MKNEPLQIEDLSIGDVFYFIRNDYVESFCVGGWDENGFFSFDDEDDELRFSEVGDMYARHEDATDALNNN